MAEWKVMITTLDEEHALAINLAERLGAVWSNYHSADFQACSSLELAQDAVEEFDAVVVIAKSDTLSHHSLAFLSTLEESGIPVVARLKERPSPGNPFDFTHTLIDTSEGDEHLLCATLLGLVHRQPVFQRLRSELNLARRFHSGMEGEIAKMHEELQLAATVQREFLPHELPALHGVEFSALWRPTNYVSGDIYDLIRLSDDQIGVFIADAVGHGVPAALMTMVITRALVTREATGPDVRIIPPSEVLARLNASMIHHQGRTTRFATAAYAIVNCRSRTMTFAGAGHPPPLLLRADGTVENIETDGGLLGIFEGETYAQVERELCVGDTMMLYSDGFEQAFPSEDMESYRDRKLPTTRYRDEFIRLGSADTPEQMISIMNKRLDDQRGSLHQLDDLTLICIRAGSLAPNPERVVPRQQAGGMNQDLPGRVNLS